MRRGSSLLTPLSQLFLGAERRLSTYTGAVTLEALQEKLTSSVRRDLLSLYRGSEYMTEPQLKVEEDVVYQFNEEDILPTEAGAIRLVVEEDVEAQLRYADKGVMPEFGKDPESILEHSLLIPKGTIGVLAIARHTPFSITPDTPGAIQATSTFPLRKIEAVTDLSKKSSLKKLTELPEDIAKRLIIELERRAYADPLREAFYEETTSKVLSPSESSPRSATLMVFEQDLLEEGSQSTDMHYHPGSRTLLIVTSQKKAGATLNFCGIKESPEDRKDLEQNLVFDPNSVYVLDFSEATHHKFHGEFSCISFHSKDGLNLTRSLQLGNLEGGFLEEATKFSPPPLAKDSYTRPASITRTAESSPLKKPTEKTNDRS